MGDIKIKTRIENLFKKAKSADQIGSIEEAAAFMAKAQELLLKYNLQESELNLGENKVNEVGHEFIDLKESHKWNKSQGDWLIRLYNYVSIYNFGKIITRGSAGLTLFGEEHNRDMIKYMILNVIPQIKSLEKRAWKEYAGTDKRGAFRRGYYRGAGNGIHHILSDEHLKNKGEYHKMTAMVKVMTADLDEKVSELFPRLGKRKGSNYNSIAGGIKGSQDASKIKLQKGISKAKQTSNNTKYLG